MLDVFLTVLLLLCIVGVILRDEALNKISKDVSYRDCVITVRSSSVDAAVFSCVEEGETLYDRDGALIGTVQSTEKLPYSVTLTEDGTVYEGAWDSERICRIQLRVLCKGTVRDGILLLGGRIPLAVGSTVSFRGSRTELEYQLLKIEAEMP